MKYQYYEVNMLTERNQISKAFIIPAHMDTGYNLLFREVNGNEFLLHTQRGQLSSYKSIDTAFNALKRLGIYKAIISLGENVAS